MEYCAVAEWPQVTQRLKAVSLHVVLFACLLSHPVAVVANYAVYNIR